MKTSHVVIGAIAIGAIVLWYRNRKVQSTSVTTADASKIPVPQSEASKIVKLPDSLLTNTSGNTGIIPPVLKQGSTPVKIAQPMIKPILKQTNLQGFAMN